MNKLLKCSSILIVVGVVFFSVMACQNDLTVETVEWESDGTDRQFFTNDMQYYEYNFYNYSGSSYDLQTNPLVAYLMKNSGAEYWGYGLIFGKQNTSAKNQYGMYVNVRGSIHVYKYVNGDYSSIIDWTEIDSSLGFITGYGKENKVMIWEDTTTDNRFYINFNDSTVSYRFDDTEDVFNSGFVGMVAAVGDSETESFPDTPADVRIRISSPVSMKSTGDSVTAIEPAKTEERIQY